MLTIEFQTVNAAFDPPNRKNEVAEILRSVAAKVAGGLTEGKVLDVNGNTVGTWTLTNN